MKKALLTVLRIHLTIELVGAILLVGYLGLINFQDTQSPPTQNISTTTPMMFPDV